MKRYAAVSILFCTVVAVATLVSCGLGPLAGGSGTETVNTYAVLSDGSPAGGAIVSVIDPQWWLDSVKQKASPVVFRAVADEQGRFSLPLAGHTRPYNLQIDHSEQGLLAESIVFSQIDDTISLEPFASYTGAFTADHDITQMNLSGSAYMASIGSDGNFFFTRVAPGSYTLVGLSGAPSPYRVAVCGSISLAAGVTSSDDSLNPEYKRLLIDHFENGFGPTALGGIAPEFWWYTVSDSGMYYWKRSTNTWKWLAYSGHSYTAILPVPGQNGGTALRFVALLDSTVSAPIATAGIFFKDLNENGLDLSGMAGFSLLARGKGTIRIRFESAGLDTNSRYLSAFSYPLRLTGQWMRYAIPVDSLRILDPVYFPNLYPWSKESKNVLRMEFEFSKYENPLEDTLHFECDDLFLEGVGVEVLQRDN